MIEKDFFDYLAEGNQMYNRVALARMGFVFEGDHSGIRSISVDIAGESREIEVVAIVDRNLENQDKTTTYLFPINKLYREMVATAEKAWSDHQDRAVRDMNA